MRRKILFLTIWALSSLLASANAPFSKFFPSETLLSPPELCDLPAPTNFQVVETGTTWVRVSFLATTPGVSHRIKTYKVTGNQLVSNIVIGAAQTPTTLVNNLQPGVSYYSTCNAICPDGTDSRFLIQTANYDTFISDMIVAGIQQSSNSPSCGISNMGQFCTFPITGETSIFKVRPINSPSGRQFNVRRLPNDVIRVVTNSNEGFYILKIDDKLPDNNGVPGNSCQAYYLGSKVAEFELHTVSGEGRMYWTMGSTGYEIVRLSAGFQGSAGDHDAMAEILETPAEAFPNPFNAVLEVFPGRPEAQNIQLQLFNLSGQKVLDQQFGGGQEQYTLSTEGLSTGFYLLRIETDGEVQTLKVIKSE